MNHKGLRRRSIAACVLGGALLLFWLLRGWRQGMDVLSACVTKPYHAALGRLTSFVPFSVAELVAVGFVLLCVVFFVRAVLAIVRARGTRLREALRQGMGAVVLALSVCVGFSLLWGVYYYGTSFETRAGISAREISVQELKQVTQLFAQRVNESAGAVPRTPQGVFAVPPRQVLEDARELYEPLEREYPFLAVSSRRTAKPMLLSQAMSVINYTGIFFPFTGEANVNMRQPGCFLPSTVAHELAHVRGIAPEQTANFVAVLACERSGKPAYVYSGYLLGYLHLSNALYSADREAWSQISAQLCDAARADLDANNAYWQQYDSVAAKAADTVYEGFLKSYDQTMGLKSYGAVVDLLVVYYDSHAITASANASPKTTKE